MAICAIAESVAWQNCCPQSLSDRQAGAVATMLLINILAIRAPSESKTLQEWITSSACLFHLTENQLQAAQLQALCNWSNA